MILNNTDTDQKFFYSPVYGRVGGMHVIILQGPTPPAEQIMSHHTRPAPSHLT